MHYTFLEVILEIEFQVLICCITAIGNKFHKLKVYSCEILTPFRSIFFSCSLKALSFFKHLSK